MANKLQRFIGKSVGAVINKVTGIELAQEENKAYGEKRITEGMPEAIRELAAEGIVLLKNDHDVLPIKQGQTVSVFGRVQNDWFKVGYGSGGNVHAPYDINLFDAFDEVGLSYNQKLRDIYFNWGSQEENIADHGYWGHWPYYYPEMPVEEQLVLEAKEESDVAIVIIGRAAGEDRENRLEKGCYYLTDIEEDMIEKVTRIFERTVLVLDCGNIMDLAFTDRYPFSSIVYAWQLGQESTHAVSDVLSGKVNPSGKLTDTIAIEYNDYPSSNNFGGKEFNNYVEDIYVGYRYFNTFAPERVKYPFGYGLSYSTFEYETNKVELMSNGIQFDIKVTNTGLYAGKEVIQVYANCPQGLLGKPLRSLVGFKKTPLLQPKESCDLIIYVSDNDYCSYDDSGITGYKDCFVLEKGHYGFFVSSDGKKELLAQEFELEETICLKKCNEIMCVENEHEFEAINPVGEKKVEVGLNGLTVNATTVSLGQRNLYQRILSELPECPSYTGDRGIHFHDVKSGEHTLDEFMCQLSNDQLADLTRGEGGMDSKLGMAGNAGSFGGITKELRKLGIPAIITADGPAGLRLKRYTTLLPCGTSIACSFNLELVERIFQKVGQEATYFGVDVNLAPGMNIHRNPLCGRNFEYYSEDPLVSGRIAAAVVKGLQASGISACPKHFACNNQEYNRNHNDSRVSVRALREIYLKNFEYCIKEGKPQNIMTSYNLINGVWSHYNYDLVTTVLRKEWGYTGNVITDWFMVRSVSKEFSNIRDNAYRTRAQVDVLMPGDLSKAVMTYRHDKSHLESFGERNGITRAELYRCAKNVLNFALTRLKEE